MFTIEYPFKKEILACGTKDWSGICLTKKNYGYIINEFNKQGQESLLDFYTREIDRIKCELKVKPRLIVHDLNSEYGTTKYAYDLSQKNKGIKCLGVQHHQAHIASCMAENGIKERVLAVVLDAPGYGEDGNYWGGEFFVGNPQDFQRVAHLKYAPLANGKEPFLDSGRQAAYYLHQTFGDDFINLPIDFIRRRPAQEWQTLIQNLNATPQSSSAANLFDAIAALVGLHEKVDYEGQGAGNLGRIINRSSHVANRIYDYKLKKENGMLLIEFEPIFENIVNDLKNNISRSIISAALHNTVIEIIGKPHEHHYY